MIAADSAAN